MSRLFHYPPVTGQEFHVAVNIFFPKALVARAVLIPHWSQRIWSLQLHLTGLRKESIAKQISFHSRAIWDLRDQGMFALSRLVDAEGIDLRIEVYLLF